MSRSSRAIASKFNWTPTLPAGVNSTSPSVAPRAKVRIQQVLPCTDETIEIDSAYLTTANGVPLLTPLTVETTTVTHIRLLGTHLWIGRATSAGATAWTFLTTLAESGRIKRAKYVLNDLLAQSDTP